MQTDAQTLNHILDSGAIHTVYQPVVSLTDGEVFGYEALSRISNKAFDMDIGRMFRLADEMNKSSELEALCRRKAFENAVNLSGAKKLFINVNPNIIHSQAFQNELTESRLGQYGLNFGNIILEITERMAVTAHDAFLCSIHHFKTLNCKIAVDDVGAGYSGLNLLIDIRPDYIKLDRHIIQDIDKDETKYRLCKAIAGFGKSIGIRLIAVGVETEGELKMLIGLGVDFGQGFFLGMPKESFTEIDREKAQLIVKYYIKKYNKTIRSSIYPIIEHISKQGYTFHPDEKAVDIYEELQRNNDINEFTVLENGIAVGIMTKSALNEIFGGRYGYSLNSKNTIRKLLKIDFLRTDRHTPIDRVSQLAMQRPAEKLYDPVVVEKGNKYLGIVTIRDLLDACTKIEIESAMKDKLQAERDAYNSEIGKERADAARKAVISSIEYARKIQNNLLPSEDVFEQAFSDYSVIWKPKDMVGGDIYWIKNFDEGTVLCVCDCTGHGVPGALLTMLVVSVFETEINEKNYKDTAQIIWKLEQRLMRVLHVAPNERQGHDTPDVNDGCDLAILYISNDGSVTVSAGNTPVFVCGGKDVTRIKGQRLFVGEGKIKNADEITAVHIDANRDNKFYIASDGLFDQMGGENGLPFGYAVFKKMILKNHKEKQAVISQKIWEAFESHRGGHARIDDIELITFKPQGGAVCS